MKSRPWTESEFAALISGPNTVLARHPAGFALGRVTGDEAELLTIAVHPDAQGKGCGRALLAEFDEIARQNGAERAFLEVGERNLPARALYESSGWVQVGARPGYYVREGGAPEDALVLSKELSAN